MIGRTVAGVAGSETMSPVDVESVGVGEGGGAVLVGGAGEEERHDMRSIKA